MYWRFDGYSEAIYMDSVTNLLYPQVIFCPFQTYPWKSLSVNYLPFSSCFTSPPLFVWQNVTRLLVFYIQKYWILLSLFGSFNYPILCYKHSKVYFDPKSGRGSWYYTPPITPFTWVSRVLLNIHVFHHNENYRKMLCSCEWTIWIGRVWSMQDDRNIPPFTHTPKNRASVFNIFVISNMEGDSDISTKFLFRGCWEYY